MRLWTKPEPVDVELFDKPKDPWRPHYPIELDECGCDAIVPSQCSARAAARGLADLADGLFIQLRLAVILADARPSATLAPHVCNVILHRAER